MTVKQDDTEGKGDGVRETFASLMTSFEALANRFRDRVEFDSWISESEGPEEVTLREVGYRMYEVLESLHFEGLPLAEKVLPGHEFSKRDLRHMTGRERALAEKHRPAVFMRDGYACRYCGARNCRLTLDHVRPVARGGTHDPSNLVAACYPCNLSKGARLPSEVGMVLL